MNGKAWLGAAACLALAAWCPWEPALRRHATAGRHGDAWRDSADRPVIEYIVKHRRHGDTLWAGPHVNVLHVSCDIAPASRVCYWNRHLGSAHPAIRAFAFEEALLHDFETRPPRFVAWNPDQIRDLPPCLRAWIDAHYRLVVHAEGVCLYEARSADGSGLLPSE